MSNKETKPIFAIAGPTASGKTALGVELALAIGGEIINCDSVQIYQGIEIATAKPSEDEKRGVPHHLIDYVDPNTNYTAADWARDAADKIYEIEERGHTAILVGGTGFYLRALRQPFFESPKTNEQLRERIKDILARKGPEYLHGILVKVDREAAQRLSPRDHIRVSRALEVYFQTGEQISSRQQAKVEPPGYASRIRIIVLSPPRELLYDKINKRTESHFANGLIDEVTSLIEQGVRTDRNALGAHGYRRVCEYLFGERSLESAVEKTKQDVRNYAKRQLTWFRSEPGAEWFNGFGDDPAVIEAVLAAVKVLKT